LSEAEEPTPPGAWEVAAEVARRYEAELIAGCLRQAGIEARVIDKSFRQEPLPIARSLAIVRLYVPSASAKEARRILSEVERPEDTEGDPQ
jgi:hypothetical protein